MLHLISSQHIDFLGKGFLAVMFSVALIIAGATSFVVRGERNFGVDFKGGDLLSLSAANNVDVGQVRTALKPLHLDNEPIQQSLQGGRNFLSLRLPLNTSEKAEAAIYSAIPNGKFKVEGKERVGALVGGELARNALWAVGLGIFGILIYVTFLFKISFAVGATGDLRRGV